MAFTTLLMKVRRVLRWELFCLRRFSAWRARFSACAELAKGVSWEPDERVHAHGGRRNKDRSVSTVARLLSTRFVAETFALWRFSRTLRGEVGVRRA
jgi:hypothetical protein